VTYPNPRQGVTETCHTDRPAFHPLGLPKIEHEHEHEHEQEHEQEQEQERA
jgi:hypothetical protein